LTKHEADEQLSKAIRDHADAYAITPEGEVLLSDFAVIAHWQNVEGDGKSKYTTHYASDYVPAHVAYGLFYVGIDLLGQFEESL
jgi:hypothetical protein